MNNLEKLELRVNEVSRIEPDTFSKMNKLKHLDMSFNFIESLHKDVFHSLLNLEYLSLDNNLLRSIDLNVFNGLVKIDELILSSNQIKFINIEQLNRLEIRKVNLAKNPVHKLLDLNNGTFSLKRLESDMTSDMIMIKPSYFLCYCLSCILIFII